MVSSDNETLLFVKESNHSQGTQKAFSTDQVAYSIKSGLFAFIQVPKFY